MARGSTPFLVLLLLSFPAYADSVHEAASFPGGARIGAGAVLLANQRILLYGGIDWHSGLPPHRTYEDLWAYDVAADRWERIPNSGPWPGPRAGHCMATDAVGTGLYLYGGTAEMVPPYYVCGNSLWHFDLVSSSWQLLESGQGPAPDGAGARMGVDPATGDPWVFMGSCAFSVCQGSLAQFIRDDGRWLRATAPRDVPAGRLASSAPFDAKRKKFLIRGGMPPLGCAFDGTESGAEAGASIPVFDPYPLWAFDPTDWTWRGLGAMEGSPANQSGPLSDYDPVSDVFLEYGGLRGRGTEASDSLWSFDLDTKSWSSLGRFRPRLDAAGAYCPCSGALFVTTGAESTSLGVISSQQSDAYFISIEQKAGFEWDGSESSRRAPWRWGTLTLDEDGPIDPSTVRLMNCAATRDLQSATEIKRIGRGRWHLRFAAASAEESDASAAGHLVLTGRVQGRPVNFLARLGESHEIAQHLSPSSALRCEPVAGGWSVNYAGENSEQARLQVFDVAGRMIARFDAPFTSGKSFFWDGRDGEGRRLANGIYFLRVTCAGGVAKAVVVR